MRDIRRRTPVQNHLTDMMPPRESCLPKKQLRQLSLEPEMLGETVVNFAQIRCLARYRDVC